MDKTIFRRIGAWVIVLTLVVGTAIVPSFAGDVSGILYDIEVSAEQDGVDIEDLPEIDFEKDIEISLSFGVPVVNDGGSAYAILNDEATIELAKGFKVTSAVGPFDLKHGGLKVGSVTLETDAGGGIDAITKAKIVFDGDPSIFDGSGGWHDVVCTFNSTLKYDGPGQDIKDEDYEVQILGKTYTIKVPEATVELAGEKTGVRDGKYIDWKVKVEATKAATPWSLEGYTFSDDLSAVGEYVAGTFMVGDNSDGSDKAIPDPDADYGSDKKLTYEFPAGTATAKYVFFRTEISDLLFYTNGSKTVTNTAKVFEGSVEKYRESKDVTFDVEWIKKEGAITSFNSVTNTGEITWTITANQLGASLPNAYITDALDSRLKWEEATFKYHDGTNWVNHPTITFASRPVDDKYELGNINYPVELTIRASVDTTKINIGHEIHTITNSATINWTGGTGTGSGSISQDIGLNPIEKAAGSYDSSTHKIPWNVKVKKSDVSMYLYVLDLLVYGSSTDGFDLDEVDAISVTSGVEIPSTFRELDLATIKTRNPQARYDQKFAGNFTSPDGLGYVVYTLEKGGKAVADLLLVTKGDGAGIDVSIKTQEFSFDTIVTNPDIYAKNGNTTIRNTATLYSDNTKINEATDSVTATSNMLVKDMLNRTDAADPDANKNNSAGSATNSYNYEDHTVVYRLHVNANDLKDLTNDLTGTDGIPVGNITLKDTLPTGWEFVEIETGKMFLIYEGVSGTGGKVTAGAVPGDLTFLTEDFTTDGEAEFTFTKLDKPYVILLKAQVTGNKIKEYFEKNGTYYPRNNAAISGTNWGPGTSTYRDVTVVSQILNKDLAVGTGDDLGILTWTVEYKPNKTGRANATITDTLPIGLDVRVKSDGSLDLDIPGNFVAKELKLNSDGTYSEVADITLVQGVNIFYNNTTRELVFKVGDPEKAYKFIYKTDVTGDAGDNLTNEVKLETLGMDAESGGKSYLVAKADADATMKRSGSLEIQKLDGKDDSPLSGVWFTLFALDGTTEIRKDETNADGLLTLKGIPIGSYVLKETGAKSGYKLHVKPYDVEVKVDGSKLVTSIDNQVGDDSNKITLYNYKEDTYGDLKITKSVTGGGGDTGESFNFTLTMNGVSGTYDYIGGGGKADGSITFVGGKAAFSLKHGETITVKYLPKDEFFTVEEDDYKTKGYSTTYSNKTGNIVVDGLVTRDVTNNKDGWVEITKKDAADGGGLAGAEFTLYASDGITVVKPAVDPTNSSGKLWILDIGVGTYYLKETKAPLNYENQFNKYLKDVTYEVEVVASGSTLITKIDGVVTNKLEVVNYENDTVGDLEIEKTLEGTTADSNKLFSFTIDAPTGVSGTYPYIGKNGKADGVLDFTSGSDTFTLKEDESIFIKYLPKGNYVVTESDYSGDGYLTSYKIGSGDLSVGLSSTVNVKADDAEAVTFKNSRTGWIVVTKEDALYGTKLSGARYTLFKDGNPVASELTDGSGRLWFYDIDIGSYTLKETAPPSGYQYQWDDKEMGEVTHTVVVKEVGTTVVTSIDGVDKNDITFKNYRDGDVGDLTIFKAAIGSAIDPSKEYEFTLEIIPLAGETYAYSGSGGKSDGTLTFNLLGKATFELKGGQSITIPYIPDGFTYKVEEKDYKPEGYTTVKTDEEGTIKADYEIIAMFTNSKYKKIDPVKTGGIIVSKRVTGSEGEKDKIFKFTFKLDGAPGSYVYSGVGVSGGLIKGGDSFTLSHGQSISIVGIPEGTKYEIVEEDYSSEGYETTPENAKGSVVADTMVSVKFTNDKDDEDVVDPEDPDDPADPSDPSKPGGDKPGDEDDSGILGEGDSKDPGKDEEGGDILGSDKSNVPKTGDDSAPILWIMILIGAVAGVLKLLRKRANDR